MSASMRAFPRAALGGAAALLLASCDRTPTSLGSRLPARFSEIVTLPDFQTHLTGPTRVVVRVIPGSLTARRVEIEEADQLARPEEIRSRVTAVTAGTNTATLTLELGGLKVAANGSTRLRPDDGDSDHADMTLAAFVARIQADLAAGHSPAVRATRPPPATPQGPAVASFLASELQLDEGNHHPLIELNITGTNLVTNATPPPDAFLKLLGLSIALRVSDGTTKLTVETPGLEGVREFDGIVQAVDLTAKTVTLKDGTIIRIVAGTEIEAREGDEDNHLTSLAAVHDSVAAGKTVKAEGRGLVETTSPLTFDAISIEFTVEGEELPPAVMVVEVEDTVASVDVASSTFTLGHGAG